jgi:hypothetical protein
MYQKKSGIVWRRLEKMRGNRLRSSRKWAGIEIGSVALVGGGRGGEDGGKWKENSA